MANLIRFFCTDCQQGGYGTPGRKYMCTLCNSHMQQYGVVYPAERVHQFLNLNNASTVVETSGDEFEEHF